MFSPASTPNPYHYYKTDRIYGAIWNMILARARKGPVTWRDFVPPLVRNQARRNLSILASRGKLKCIQMGRSGCKQSRPSIYAMIDNEPAPAHTQSNA